LGTVADNNRHILTANRTGNRLAIPVALDPGLIDIELQAAIRRARRQKTFSGIRCGIASPIVRPRQDIGKILERRTEGSAIP
jgi:hypothetical protein